MEMNFYVIFCGKATRCAIKVLILKYRRRKREKVKVTYFNSTISSSNIENTKEAFNTMLTDRVVIEFNKGQENRKHF